MWFHRNNGADAISWREGRTILNIESIENFVIII